MARFGIPESITMDNVMVFKGAEMRRFTQEFGIALINSTPYHAQANGQAKLMNKI
jgi:hypothetical protein